MGDLQSYTEGQPINKVCLRSRFILLPNSSNSQVPAKESAFLLILCLLSGLLEWPKCCHLYVFDHIRQSRGGNLLINIAITLSVSARSINVCYHSNYHPHHSQRFVLSVKRGGGGLWANKCELSVFLKTAFMKVHFQRPSHKRHETQISKFCAILSWQPRSNFSTSLNSHKYPIMSL